MGKIIKKIVGDVDKDPKYENLTIEVNKGKKTPSIHIHIKNVRLDLSAKAYNIFYDSIKESYGKLYGNK